jgi:exonuclease III
MLAHPMCKSPHLNTSQITKKHTLNIFTLNINGLNQPRKYKELKQLQSDYKWHILVLTDTRLNTDETNLFLAQKVLKPKHFSYVKSPGQSGGILILYYIAISNLLPHFTSDHRILQNTFSHLSQNFTITAVYAPPQVSQRASWYSDTLPSFLDLHPQNGDYHILTGDFNAVDNTELDCSNANSTVHRPTFSRQSITDLNLQDAFRTLHPNKHEFTHFPSHGTAARLDRTYLNDSATPTLVSASHIHPSASLTDHFSGIEIKLKLTTQNTKSSGYWILSNNLLKRPAFKRTITSILKKYNTDLTLLPADGSWWEALKSEIKSQSIPLGQTDSQRIINTKKYLRKKLNTYNIPANTNRQTTQM